MKLQTVLLLSCLIVQTTTSFAQSTKPATFQELIAFSAAGVETLTKNSQEIQSKVGLYAPTDSDLARFIFADAESIRQFRENTMALTMDKTAQFVIATIDGREVLLRSSSIQRDGVFDLRASGGFAIADVPGNKFLRELQAGQGDSLKVHLTVLADGSFKYEATLESMYDDVERKILDRKTGNLRFAGSRIDRELRERAKNPLTIDTREAVRKVEKR